MPNITQSAYRLANTCFRQTVNVSFHVERRNPSFFSQLFCVRNASERLCINVHDRSSHVNLRKVYQDIDNAIYRSGQYKPEWVCQETVNVLSAEVNNVIDLCRKKYHVNFTENQKRRVFDNISSRLGGVIHLDPKCTQSSIDRAVTNSSYVSRKIDILVGNRSRSPCEMAQISDQVKNKLVGLVFENKFDGVNLEQVRVDAMKYALREFINSNSRSN